MWMAADAGRVGPYLGPERGATSSSVILQFGLASNRIQAMLAACIQFVLWCLHTPAAPACQPGVAHTLVDTQPIAYVVVYCPLRQIKLC